MQNNVTTTIEVKEEEIEIKNAKIYKLSIATFTIKNTGDVPLSISQISASCEWTVPEWAKRPVKPGDMTEVRVKITPNHAGYLRKTVNVLCNTEKGVIPLVVKSMIKE